jgi:hypothetical protein
MLPTRGCKVNLSIAMVVHCIQVEFDRKCEVTDTARTTCNFLPLRVSQAFSVQVLSAISKWL